MFNVIFIMLSMLVGAGAGMLFGEKQAERAEDKCFSWYQEDDWGRPRIYQVFDRYQVKTEEDAAWLFKAAVGACMINRLNGENNDGTEKES